MKEKNRREEIRVIVLFVPVNQKEGSKSVTEDLALIYGKDEAYQATHF